MRPYPLPALFAVAALCACSSTATSVAPVPLRTLAPTGAPTTAPGATATPVPTATPIATATPVATAIPTATPAPTAAPSAQPQVVHVGFTHAASTDPTFGAIAFYTGSNTASAPASVVTVTHGSQIVFMTDSTSPHTASGLGTSGFPGTGPGSGATSQTGSTINGTSWSTGTLSANATSAAFTVGPPGDYYFGCFYHYSADGMRDVIVSQ